MCAPARDQGRVLSPRLSRDRHCLRSAATRSLCDSSSRRREYRDGCVGGQRPGMSRPTAPAGANQTNEAASTGSTEGTGSKDPGWRLSPLPRRRRRKRMRRRWRRKRRSVCSYLTRVRDPVWVLCLAARRLLPLGSETTNSHTTSSLHLLALISRYKRSHGTCLGRVKAQRETRSV